MLLYELGESGLIARIGRYLADGGPTVIRGIGDDAAVLSPPGENQWLVATTDMLVEGVHFRRDWCNAADIGYKAIAVNISDVAAMGGVPETALVSLALPGHLPVAWADDLYAGMQDCAGEYGVRIVGGDTVGAAAGKIVINVSLLGRVEINHCLFRHAARPGQLVVVTGPLGGAAGGLAVLEHPRLAGPYGEDLRAAYRRPRPRVAAGRVLAVHPGVGAVQDISDGLAVTASQVAEASGMGIEIYAASLPLAPGLEELGRALGRDPVDFVLYGGEDFELLFTISPDQLPTIRQELTATGVQPFPVGIVLPPGEGCWLVNRRAREVLKPRGYAHFTPES